MEGMHFLLLNEQGKPMGHGVIASRINQDRYLCTFLRAPQVSRVVHVDEIGTWNLFPNQDGMNAFIAALPKAKPAPGTPPPKPDPNAKNDPASKKTAKKKKASKKKTSKKKTGK